jgi:hypothetical protein
MKLDEIFDKVLIESGQFQIAKDCVELDADRFLILVKSVLGIYNKYSPIMGHVQKDINLNRQYTFTDENTTQVRDSNGLVLPFGGAPEWILDALPVRIAGTYPYFLREFDRPKSNLDIKVEYPWEYRKPVLTVPVQGEYDIKAVYFHRVTQTTDGIFEVVTITDLDEAFFKLLLAKFLFGIGRSRRAFTLQDLPITHDGAELVSEAKELNDQAYELLQNSQRFYLAWR